LENTEKKRDMNMMKTKKDAYPNLLGKKGYVVVVVVVVEYCFWWYTQSLT